MKRLIEFFDESSAVKVDDELMEYILVACPDTRVTDRINDEKQRFSRSYGSDRDTGNDYQIVIASFQAKEILEETLVRWIQNVCNLQTSFHVSLNNFSGFPTGIIYLRVQNEQPFQKLAGGLKILSGFLESNGCSALNVVTKPHMAITGKLPSDIYEKVIHEYSHHSFHETFKVDRLMMLKIDGYMNCHTVTHFTLPSPLTYTIK